MGNRDCSHFLVHLHLRYLYDFIPSFFQKNQKRETKGDEHTHTHTHTPHTHGADLGDASPTRICSLHRSICSQPPTGLQACKRRGSAVVEW